MPTHDPASTRHAADGRVSLAEASALARRDRKTLLKDIADGRFPNAIQEAGGRRARTLLVQDLLDAGLVDPDQVAPPGRAGAESPPFGPEQLRVLELEARVRAQDAVAEEFRAEVARLHELAMAPVAQLGTPCKHQGKAE